MGIIWQIVVALLVGELFWAAYLLIAAARVPPDAPGARFNSGWLGTCGLLLGLSQFVSTVVICMGPPSWLLGKPINKPSFSAGRDHKKRASAPKREGSGVTRCATSLIQSVGATRIGRSLQH